MTELKACPWCSGPTVRVEGHTPYVEHRPLPHCPVRRGPFTAEQWNTRTPSISGQEVVTEALRKIALGSKLGIEMFEQRVHERKGRLTWYAVNVLQDNLAACVGTAEAAMVSAVSLGDLPRD